MYNPSKRVIASSLLLFCIFLFFNCSTGIDPIEDVEVSWQLTDSAADSPGTAMTFILKNNNKESQNLKNWALKFNAIYPVLDTVAENYEVSNLGGNLFQITFKSTENLGSGDSIAIHMESMYAINNKSAVPNGLYFHYIADESIAKQVGKYTVHPFTFNAKENIKRLEALYNRNNISKVGTPQLILPTPLDLKVSPGSWSPDGDVLVAISQEIPQGNKLFNEVSEVLPNINVIRSENQENTNFSINYDANLMDEAYVLETTSDGVTISSSSYSGAFYALQSLRSAITAHQLGGEEDLSLPLIKVFDKPRFAYRAQHIDIARNFHSKELLLRLIDAFSHYKINTLHLHFIDDEGWRIEIPDLPELTEVGARRSAFYGDNSSIQPVYGSGVDTGDKGYLTRDDFIELLRYAADRCITIIPEIETPGHAHAAINAMKARYNRLMKEGDKEAAEEYMLHDPEDESEYLSVQYFNDNVMDVGRESTYKFLEKVIDELSLMYKEADLTLKTVHMGGDEVPIGSWEKSPSIKRLMEKENLSHVYEVWPFYISKIRDILQDKGMEMGGWEEVGMINKGEGMEVNEDFNKQGLVIDVWNNVLGQGQEDLAYRLANAGYKTILVSSSNFYLDMAWDDDWNEPGFRWASYTDLYHAYSFLPEDYFTNIFLAERAKPLGKDYFNDKKRLTDEGKKNLLGVKGALWSETILTDERVEYMLFPRVLAVAERGWSPQRAYEREGNFNENTFNQDFSNFAHAIGYKEIPKLSMLFKDINYRVPSVGVKEENGMLLANSEIPNFTIYYTTDGKSPTINSSIYNAPITFEEGTTYKFVAIDKNNKRGRVSIYAK